MKAVKPKRPSADGRRFNGCEMELARGASHIASMLYEQSIYAAVRETLFQFETSSGRNDLMAFAAALLRKLEQRGKMEAVKKLRDFIEHGHLPEQIPGVPTGQVSIRKPRVTQSCRHLRTDVGKFAMKRKRGALVKAC